MSLKEAFAREIEAVVSGRAADACPPPDRWWAVATGAGSWDGAEQRNTDSCPKCQRMKARFQCLLKHPPLGWLVAWTKGRLTPDDALEVGGHLEKPPCERCAALAAILRSGTEDVLEEAAGELAAAEG